MPFVLPPERAEQWLDGSLTDTGKAMELLQPNPDDAIAFHRISTRVSSARNQGADLIAAIQATVSKDRAGVLRRSQ